MIFPKYVNLNGLQLNVKFSDVSEKLFFHFIVVGYKNVKNNFFEEKSIFSEVFIELKCM